MPPQGTRRGTRGHRPAPAAGLHCAWRVRPRGCPLSFNRADLNHAAADRQRNTGEHRDRVERLAVCDHPRLFCRIGDREELKVFEFRYRLPLVAAGLISGEDLGRVGFAAIGGPDRRSTPGSGTDRRGGGSAVEVVSAGAPKFLASAALLTNSAHLS